MSRKKGRGAAGEQEIAERAAWISSRLDAYGEGVHDRGSPAVVLDLALPLSVDAVYREFDGARLFHETLTLFTSVSIERSEAGFHVGEYAGDEIFVDDKEAVWRLEQDTGELLPDGTRFDRWLAGVVDAESVLYEHDGEFRDEIFDEDGELLFAAAAERERRQLKRDPKAVAPRWRLARALSNQDKLSRARDCLESVVEQQPDFPWAWFDLGRISERLGALETASEEVEMAADAKPGYEHNGYFLAQAARLADAAGLEDRARELAAKALRREPDLATRQREGARDLLEAGDREAARELLVLAKIISPRDLETIDLLRQLES